MCVQTMRPESWFNGLMYAKEYLYVSRRVTVLRMEIGDNHWAGDATAVKK